MGVIVELLRRLPAEAAAAPVAVVSRNGALELLGRLEELGQNA